MPVQDVVAVLAIRRCGCLAPLGCDLYARLCSAVTASESIICRIRRAIRRTTTCRQLSRCAWSDRLAPRSGPIVNLIKPIRVQLPARL